jgi:hypothetical protein
MLLHLPQLLEYNSINYSATSALHQPCCVSRLLRALPLGLLSGRTGSTSNTPCAATTCSRPHRLYVNCAVHRDYLSADCNGSTSTTSHVRMPRLVAWLIVNYFSHAAHTGASAHRVARHTVRRRLLCLLRASGCLVTSHGSSSTTSPTPRVRVPRHVARLVTRLVVDYFAYAVRPGVSARHVARRRPRAFSPLDFSSVGCTGSHRAPDRSVSRLYYSVCRHSNSATPCIATTCLAATPTLLRVRRASPRHRLSVASRRPLISTSFPN